MRVASLTSIALLLVGCSPGFLAATPAAPDAPAPRATTRPAERTLLTFAGNGGRTSQPFDAPSEWYIDYRYDCSSFGQDGNFIVFVNDSDGLVAGPVNELGSGGSDRSYVYESGRLHIEIISVCDWSLTAKT